MIRNKQVVLITGGLGFIGLHLASELIDHGYTVALFDNLNPQIHGQVPKINDPILLSPQISVVRGDVTDSAALRLVLPRVNVIIHLAAETGTAQSMYQIANYNKVNSQGIAMLLDLLANGRHNVRKIVLASSRSIYGEGSYHCAKCGIVYPEPRSRAALESDKWEPPCSNCGGNAEAIPTSESAKANPTSIYAATKLAQESLLRIACNAINIDHVILRLQNVYGAGQSLNNPYTGILSIFSTRIRQGLNLPIFEDGLESRDFINVTDVATAIRLCIEKDEANSKIMNVGSGNPTSVLEVANMLVEAFDSKNRIEITGEYRLGDIRHCYADIKLMSNTLGFEPQTKIESGIAYFVQWVKAQALPEDNLDKANEELKRRKMMG